MIKKFFVDCSRQYIPHIIVYRRKKSERDASESLDSGICIGLQGQPHHIRKPEFNVATIRAISYYLKNCELHTFMTYMHTGKVNIYQNKYFCTFYSFPLGTSFYSKVTRPKCFM